MEARGQALFQAWGLLFDWLDWLIEFVCYFMSHSSEVRTGLLLVLHLAVLESRPSRLILSTAWPVVESAFAILSRPKENCFDRHRP